MDNILFKFNNDYKPETYFNNMDDFKNLDINIDSYKNLLNDFINNNRSYDLYPFFYITYIGSIDNSLKDNIYKYIDLSLEELNDIALEQKDNKDIFFDKLNNLLTNIDLYTDDKFIDLLDDRLFLKYMKSNMDDRFMNVSKSFIPSIKNRLEYLVSILNEDALYIYGYMHYGDTKLYNCDFNIVRDTMEKLVQISDNSMYQVTLGYMHYYGYGYEKDYKEAFYHFSIGLLSGNTEARYMISDMLHDGLGVKKNLVNSYKLLEDIYNEYIFDANNNIFSNSFGDACLRMAKFKPLEEQTEEELIVSLNYLLKAEYAVNERKFENYFGDDYVRGDIVYYLYLFKKYIKKTSKAFYLNPLDIIPFINNSKVDCNIKGRLNKKKDRLHITLSLPKGEEALVSIPSFYRAFLTNKLTFDIVGDIIINRNDFIFSDEIDMKIRYAKMIDGGIKFQSFHNYIDVLCDGFMYKSKDNNLSNVDGIDYSFIRVNLLDTNIFYTYLVDDIEKYIIDSIIDIKMIDGYHKVKVIDKFNFNSSDTIIDLSLCKRIE